MYKRVHMSALKRLSTSSFLGKEEASLAIGGPPFNRDWKQAVPKAFLAEVCLLWVQNASEHDHRSSTLAKPKHETSSFPIAVHGATRINSGLHQKSSKAKSRLPWQMQESFRTDTHPWRTPTHPMVILWANFRSKPKSKSAPCMQNGQFHLPRSCFFNSMRNRNVMISALFTQINQ